MSVRSEQADITYLGYLGGHIVLGVLLKKICLSYSSCTWPV